MEVLIILLLIIINIKSSMNENPQSLITEDNLTDPLTQNTSSNRTFFQRTFGPINSGSMRIAIFSMMASAMGTGIFNLPLRVQEVGLLAFILYVILAVIFSYSGAIMLARMIKAKGFNSYSDMSETAFGKILKGLSQFCLILYPWGIAVCFQVILTKFIIQLLADNFGLNFYDNRDDEIYNTTGNLVRIGINVVVIATNFLLIVQKEIGILQKLSFLGVVSVAFNVIAIFILLLTGFTRPMDDKPDLVYHGLFHLDWSKVRLFILDDVQSLSCHAQALASILFCYVNHQLIFPISLALTNPSERRLCKTFRRANFVEMSVYIIIGSSGYLLLVEHDKSYPIGAMVITSITNWSITVGKVLMVLALYLAIPLNMFPSRTIVYEAFQIEKTNKKHFLLSIVMAVSSCGVAIAFQHVNSYFGLLGGTAGVLMAGGIPALCYLKLVVLEKPEKICKNMVWEVYCLIITMVAFTGAILSIADPH